MNILPKLICDVCNTNEALGVASSPFLPVSWAYCRECLNTKAQPFSDIIFILADVGGDINNLMPEERTGFEEVIKDTLERTGKTKEELDAAVKETIKDLADFHPNVTEEM